MCLILVLFAPFRMFLFFDLDSSFVLLAFHSTPLPSDSSFAAPFRPCTCCRASTTIHFCFLFVHRTPPFTYSGMLSVAGRSPIFLPLFPPFVPLSAQCTLLPLILDLLYKHITPALAKARQLRPPSHSLSLLVSDLVCFDDSYPTASDASDIQPVHLFAICDP